MAIQSRYIVWIDAGGRTRAVIPEADPDSSSIMSNMQAVSNADVLHWFEGPENPLTPSPVSASFPDVADLVRLNFIDAGGSIATLAIPAPQAGIFLADQVTVDPAAIAALITACVGTLISPAGNTVVSFIGGVRNQRSSGA